MDGRKLILLSAATEYVASQNSPESSNRMHGITNSPECTECVASQNSPECVATECVSSQN